MERENYYLLLDLSVDPAEKDPQVIEDAIKKKQSQWSRYRNHPTKAIQAKRYIGLIPEIRKVMTDDELRRKEVQHAKKMLRQSEEVKFSKLDSHLDILMSKGSVTKKEIDRLARIHHIGEDEIGGRVKKKEKIFKIDRDIQVLVNKGAASNDKKIASLAKRYAIGEKKIRGRIEKKKEEMFAEIDKYLDIRKGIGYVTEGAVTQISKLYNLSEGDILTRLKCPIRKQRSDGTCPNSLDKTLERLISDNLKIVGKSSLYDFLGVLPDAKLEVLQEKAKEKETEIRRIGQKDAVITASGALAGHCIVIFKSKESRSSYDITRSRAHLSDFNTDIDTAGIEGKIRTEYFDILIKKAMSIGMDVEEAVDYIREYCNKEKWIIKEKKRWFIAEKKRLVFLEKWTVELDPRKKSFWAFCGAVLAFIFIVSAGVMGVGRIIQANRIKNAYQTALASLESQQDLETKEKALHQFMKGFGETEYAAAFKIKLAEIRKQIEKRDFESAFANAEKLKAEKRLEEAKTVYEGYLAKHPKGAHVREIKGKISEIPGLMDDRDYEALLTLNQEDYTERMKAYQEYSLKYPEGRHIEDVRRLNLNMIGKYYAALKKDLARCEKEHDWENCIRLCDAFIENFGDSAQASKAEGLKIRYGKRIQYRKDLDDMRQQAEQKGIDYLAARDIYSEYMNANPEAPSYVKGIIKKDIAELERKHNEYVRQEKEWDDTAAYCTDKMNKVSDRLKKMERYVSQNASGRHIEEAMPILEELKRKKRREDERMEETRGQREWYDLVAHSKNLQISLVKRIQKAERYVAENASGKYVKNAAKILSRLKEEKRLGDERIRTERENRARRLNELKRMQALVRQTGGRFVANGNGTITDRKTGLMWCTLDSLSDLGRCLDHPSSTEYVKRLRTGGYKNWRVPSANEVVGIYKNRPFFPSGGAKWFWTSDIVWHGWNKKVHIVTSKKETAWNKDQAEPFKCGSVRAVRNR